MIDHILIYHDYTNTDNTALLNDHILVYHDYTNTDNTAPLIDHILVYHDYTNTLDRLISGNFINNISDHLPKFILVDAESTNDSKHDNRPYIRLMSERNS